MGSGIVFWIVCGCMIFSLCESLWRSFRAIRNSETKQDVSDRWCGLIGNVFVYSTFIALYATESFGCIYDYSYAANLISIVIICSVAFEFLFAADEYFKPEVYLPMSPSNIKDRKEKHQAELSGTTEEDDNKDNSNT